MAVNETPRWWQALNPAIYLISILPGIAVWQLLQPAETRAYALLGATLAVVLTQHAVNLLNDVSDWHLGADTEKWDSWVRFHDRRSQRARVHGWVSLLLGGLLGTATLWASDRLWILLIALPMVALGCLYNSGRRPLSYTRLGEWVTGLCYGPGVVGCLWLLSGGEIDFRLIAAMLAFAALAVALLLSHQPPQIATDRQAGKHSFAVRYGEAVTVATSRVLFAAFIVAWAVALEFLDYDLATLAVGTSLVVWAAVHVARPGLNPKRILVPAGGMIALGFLPPLGFG